MFYTVKVNKFIKISKKKKYSNHVIKNSVEIYIERLKAK